MRRRTLVAFLVSLSLLALGLGMTAIAGPQADRSSPVETAVEASAAAPASEPAAESAARCNCNTSVGLCPQAGQTCQACPCLSTDATKNGVCQ